MSMYVDQVIAEINFEKRLSRLYHAKEKARQEALEPKSKSVSKINQEV